MTINFTKQEWRYILDTLNEDYHYYGGLLTKEARMLHEEIMDRIRDEINENS